ncbi:hypothetical protein S245_010421 [Arachis hypogaea]
MKDVIVLVSHGSSNNKLVFDQTDHENKLLLSRFFFILGCPRVDCLRAHFYHEKGISFGKCKRTHHGIRAWLTMCLEWELNTRSLGEAGPDTTKAATRPKHLF